MILKALQVSALVLLLAACSSRSDEATLGTSGASTGTTTGADGGFGNNGSDLGSGVSTSDVAGQAQPGTQQDLEVNVGDRVFFGYDGAVLDDTARKTLERQASWLQQFPGVAVTVEGHCDERGTREYNLALSERRASAVKSYLTSLGVESNRVVTIGYGSERPVDPGHDESAYALNRRGVTLVNVTQ